MLSIPYILPANASASLFKDNTNHSYKIRLPHRLHLEGGKWAIGMKSFSYPFNWHNVSEGNNSIEVSFLDKSDTSGNTRLTSNLHLRPGTYRIPEQLAEEINDKLEKKGLSESFGVYYDDLNALMVFRWASGFDTRLKFDRDLAVMVGAKPKHWYKKSVALDNCSAEFLENSPDMNAGYHRLYVYCSLCQPRVVGDSEVALLLDVATPRASKAAGSQVTEIPSTIQQIPVSSTNTDIVEILIRTADGSPVLFRGGLVSVTVELYRLP